MGVAKNFELTAGGVGIAYNYLGVCYSAELFDFLHFGTTVVGSFLISLDGSGDSEFGSIIIPRLSIGNENRNITIGFLGASIQNFNNWIYGGYFGAQRRIHERWTLAGELATINLDTYNYMYVGNVIAKFKRNSAVNWYNTYKKFMKGECGKPKKKNKFGTGSIYLTRELFKFVIDRESQPS